MPVKNITLISHHGGGGHQANAQALKAIIAAQCSSWQTEDANLFQDILNFPLPEAYNLMLKLGWTRLFWPTVPWFNLYRRLRYRIWFNKLKHYWQQRQPDLVVSCLPFFNREFYYSLQQIHPGVPLVVLFTDFATDPPHFWLETWQGESNLFTICPTARAQQQTLELGYPETQVFQTSGVILHPRFYQAISPPEWNKPGRTENAEPSTSPLKRIPVDDIYAVKNDIHAVNAEVIANPDNQLQFDRSQERLKLGLDPDLLTGVVSFGGHGAANMLEIAQRLEASNLSVQLIFLCGKNQSLIHQLHRRSYRYPYVAQGFTHNIPYYLSLADFFIGKPGPGSLSEAIALNLPVITVCNASVFWHERYNAQWIQEQQVGIVLPSFRTIEDAVSTLMQPQTLQRYQENTKKIKNRAIFEVIEILQNVLDVTLT